MFLCCATKIALMVCKLRTVAALCVCLRHPPPPPTARTPASSQVSASLGLTKGEASDLISRHMCALATPELWEQLKVSLGLGSFAVGLLLRTVHLMIAKILSSHAVTHGEFMVTKVDLVGIDGSHQNLRSCGSCFCHVE